MKISNSYIGRPIERTEDLRFLRGRGTYVADVNRPRQLTAAILRSSLAHGRLRGINASRALAMPGVHRVLAANDFDNEIPRIALRLQPLPQLAPFHQPMIADKKVRYVGEPVALVVAETAQIARSAGRHFAATPTRRSRRRTTCGVGISRCSGMQRCSWNRGALSPIGMAKRSPSGVPQRQPGTIGGSSRRRSDCRLKPSI